MPLKRAAIVSQDPTELVVSTSSYKKRKLPTKKRTTRPKLQLLSAPGTPFPQRCRAVLKYCSYFSLDPAAATVGTYVLRCNSAYDIDFSGIGGQPRGFDQYALLYNQYTVNKTSIKAWPALPNTGATGQAMYGITIVPSTPLTPAIDQCADRPYTKWKLASQQTAPKDNLLTHSWNRNKRFPRNDTVASLSSAIDANPAEQELYQFWYYSAYNPNTANPGEMTVQYEMMLDIEFYELKEIPAS